MAKILYQGTHGTDEPTRASMPFHMALGTSEAGHAAEISLAGDATYCIQDLVIAHIQGVGTSDHLADAGMRHDRGCNPDFRCRRESPNSASLKQPLGGHDSVVVSASIKG